MPSVFENPFSKNKPPTGSIFITKKQEDPMAERIKSAEERAKEFQRGIEEKDRFEQELVPYGDLQIVRKEARFLERIEEQLVGKQYKGMEEPLQDATALRAWLINKMNKTWMNKSWVDVNGHVQQLNLDDILLTELPEEIGNLTQLKELYLSSNQLTTVPESLGNLTQLNQLWLNHNRLTTVPESLGNLTQLKKLGIDNNQLTTVPESLGDLTQLKELQLQFNQLTTVPESFCNLTQLGLLFLNGNPLRITSSKLKAFLKSKNVDMK